MFTVIKTGYSAGVYGCSNEYFTVIVIKGRKEEGIKTSSYHIKGLYGEEDRIKELLEKEGFTFFYSNGVYGRVPSREYPASYFSTLEEVVENVKQL